MSAFNQNNLASYRVFNGFAPTSEPRALRVDIDFSVNNPYPFDLELATTQDKLEFVQGVYIDNGKNPYSITITCGITGQRITALPYTQGYYPALVPNNPSFSVTTNAAFTGIVPIHFLNFPMPADQWNAIESKLFNYISLNSTNSNLIKAGTGAVSELIITNTDTTPCYLKFYDKVTAPIIGTDTPLAVLAIPPNWTQPFFPSILSGVLPFNAGIGFGITGGVANSDTTAVAAGKVTLALEYA